MDVLLSVLSLALTAVGLAVAIDSRRHGRRSADYDQRTFELTFPDQPPLAVARRVRTSRPAAASGVGVDDLGEPITAREYLVRAGRRVLLTAICWAALIAAAAAPVDRGSPLFFLVMAVVVVTVLLGLGVLITVVQQIVGLVARAVRPRHDGHVVEALSRPSWLLALGTHVALVAGQVVAVFLLAP